VVQKQESRQERNQTQLCAQIKPTLPENLFSKEKHGEGK
jgi:hypothetical protein